MAIYFAEMIPKERTVKYIDDIFLRTKSKKDMWKKSES